MEHRVSHSSGTRSAAVAALITALLGAGPSATVWFVSTWLVSSGAITASMVPAALFGTLVLWSPLPVSLPAFVLGDARDRALPQLRTPAQCLLRGVLLVPHLMLSPSSTVRAQMTASVAGFAAAAVWAAAIVGWL